MTKNIRIQFTKSGKPALWEEGGGASNTGYATIVCAPDGAALRPYYVRTRGSLSCGQHALLPADKGAIVVQASHHRRDFNIDVYRLVEQAQQAPGETEAVVATERLASFSEGEWDNPDVAKTYKAAIAAARGKATAYHCRRPSYIDFSSVPSPRPPVTVPAPLPVVLAPVQPPASPLHKSKSTVAVVETRHGGRVKIEVTETHIIIDAVVRARHFKLDAAGIVDMLNHVLKSGYFCPPPPNKG